MTLAETQMTSPEETGGESRARDYERVREAIAFVSENWRGQPQLDAIAAHVGLSPTHFQRLFTRWAGISPKEFLQAITVDHARELLRDSASILEATYEVGLSGPGRLHDLFVDHEAMSPGEYKRRGEGLDIAWGCHHSPFGEALVMCTPRGIAGLAFADAGGRQAAYEDLARRWPGASYREAQEETALHAARVFEPHRWRADDPLKVVLIGTDFEIRVWRELLKVPMGRAISYGDIAAKVCSPAAARAVGTAVGRNPISFVVPCHRVLRKGGGLGGYHWGVTRKRAIIGWESARVMRVEA